MKHFPGKFHEMAFSLLLTTIVAVLVACSSSDPTPPPRSGSEDRALKQTVEALSRDVATLETKESAKEDTETSIEEVSSQKAQEKPKPTVTAKTPSLESKTYSRKTYSDCLDEMYLYWAGASQYGLPMILWRCQQLEPEPDERSNPARCWRNEAKELLQLYDDWPQTLSQWWSAVHCITPLAPRWRNTGLAPGAMQNAW